MSGNPVGKINKLSKEAERFLKGYRKSIILQNYFLNILTSFVYSNLIKNFFRNLKQENIAELNLPDGVIGEIKNDYRRMTREVNAALRFSKGAPIIDKKYYIGFRKSIGNEYPGILPLIIQIENLLKYKQLVRLLQSKRTAFKKLGSGAKDWESILTINALELMFVKHGGLPSGEMLNKEMSKAMLDIFPTISSGFKKILDKRKHQMLHEQRLRNDAFQANLYKRWQEPLDLLECLIRVSFESGEHQLAKLKNRNGVIVNPKHDALLQIHARAVQISKEIFVLMKSGFADGAIARWRSLHELSVISKFLGNSDESNSQQYLEHVGVKNYKEAIDYQEHCKKLGYTKFRKKELNKLKNIKDSLCSRHGNEYKKDYGWLPDDLGKEKHFRSLEKHVELDKMRPFYNLSCNAVHGGAKGFWRMGLIDERQKEIMLAGPSNYGLADPLLNTSMSLTYISFDLLGLHNDIENTIHMQMLSSYAKEIRDLTPGIQERIRKNDLRNNRDGKRPFN